MQYLFLLDDFLMKHIKAVAIKLKARTTFTIITRFSLLRWRIDSLEALISPIAFGTVFNSFKSLFNQEL